MKVSLNTILGLNSFYKTTGNVAEIGVEKLTEKIGAQLGAVDEVIDIGSKYQGIVVAKVVKCEKHPDADKLHVCMVDIGKSEPIQVVCGAPNVREGLTVAWIPPGVTVPESVGKEPFVLEARQIRGQTSNGMLASPKELALGDSHEGILELPDELAAGSDFAEVTGLKNDVVFDIENKMFTHRPDCFGFLGIARELAGIQGMAFKSPDWYVPEPEFPKAEGDLKLTVSNEIPELVPRFSALAIKDIKIGPSPLWLVVELTKLGQKPINNIVDLTNYFMLLTGQPLHAYDYEKVAERSEGDPTIVVRKPRKGEKLKLLNGKEIEPAAEAILIATNQEAIGLGGVMGGADTEVSDSTTNIILEAANFDMYSIRRTSMAHGLFTDAVTRFSKGQSPLQTLTVLARIAGAVQDLAAGQAGQLVDEKSNLKMPPTVSVTTDFINARLGLQLSAEEMAKLLTNVEFDVQSGDELKVTAPFWRTDIELPEDIVEEVGRLYGYDHLALELPKRDLTPAVNDPLLTAKAEIRHVLSKAGASEVLTYSFAHGNLLDKTGQDKSLAFQIGNALSPDLQYYRLSLTPSLLDKVHANIKAGYDRFALFEVGKAHGGDEMDEGVPKEYDRVCLIYAAIAKADKQSGYYKAQLYARTLLEHFGAWQDLKLVPLTELDVSQYPMMQQFLTPYDPDRSAALHNGKYPVGVIGEFRSSVKRALKLPAAAAGFEIFLSALKDGAVNDYRALPRFPKVIQDITLSVPTDTSYQTVFDFVWQELDKLRPEQSLPTLSPVSIYQPESDVDHKHITLRLTIASYQRTLTDDEVNKLLDAVAAAARDALHAERA